MAKEDLQKKLEEANPDRLRTMDDFIRLGRYCFLVLIVAELMTLTSLANMIYMVYAGNAPTVLSYGNMTIVDGKEGCKQYEQLKKTNPNLETQYEAQFNSFKLFCHDGHQVKDSISVQMAGVLFGALFSGYASDKYGRKGTLMVALAGIGIFSIWVANASSLRMFTISRFCVGIFTGALTSVQGVFLIENIPRKHRLWINTAVTWSPNFIIFPFIAYLCMDWRILSYFSSGVAIASMIALALLEESPRWKVSIGDIAGARKSLHRINKIDGINDPEETEHLERMLEHEKEVSKFWNYDRFSCTISEKMNKVPINLFDSLNPKSIFYGLLHVVASLLNYGFLFNMDKLSGSLYWNNVVFGILRWVINISAGLADYCLECFGRKMLNTTALFYIVPSLVAIISIYHGSEFKVEDLMIEYRWFVRYLTIGVTAMTSQLYLAVFIITSEVFPTSVRNVMASMLSVCSRVATIFSPQLFYLAEITPSLPYVVMLVVTIIDWILLQSVLPETKGTHLLNRIPDKKEKNLLSRKQSMAEA